VSHNKNSLDLFRDDDSLFPRGMFPGFFSNFWDNFGFGGLRVNVREKKDAYIIEAEMPGIDKKNIDIDVTDNILTISANVDERKEQRDDDGRYIRRERRSGSFRRSFSLDNVKADQINAEMKNGVLTVYCPKKNESSPNSRRIIIQ